jgi:hypothetical protein
MCATTVLKLSPLSRRSEWDSFGADVSVLRFGNCKRRMPFFARTLAAPRRQAGCEKPGPAVTPSRACSLKPKSVPPSLGSYGGTGCPCHVRLVAPERRARRRTEQSTSAARAGKSVRCAQKKHEGAPVRTCSVGAARSGTPARRKRRRVTAGAGSALTLREGKPQSVRSAKGSCKNNFRQKSGITTISGSTHKGQIYSFVHLFREVRIRVKSIHLYICLASA